MTDVLKAMLKAARLAGRRPLTTVLSLPGRLVPSKAMVSVLLQTTRMVVGVAVVARVPSQEVASSK